MMQIETQLGQLRLHGMNQSWKAMAETRQHNELSLTEGLEILLQAEQQERENRRFDRLQPVHARWRWITKTTAIIF
jgi:hypothetical protein